MKKAIGLLLFFINISYAQTTWYAAAKSGLNLRENPDPNSKVIQRIPYSKAFQLQYTLAPVEYTFENFQGYWLKAAYEGKTGYVFSEFIFPFPPPDTSFKTLSRYIESFPLACGPVSFKIQGDADGLGEEVTDKYLTKNGIMYYSVGGYEYGAFVCILPGFNIYKAFHLIRLLEEFKTTFAHNDHFPTNNQEVKLNESENFTLHLTKSDNWVSRIELRWDGDGYPEQLNIYFVGSELVIEQISGF